jgi:hypothetical protein
MALKAGTRMGGRGCPSCGSHDTEGLGKGGAQWCLTCNHRWAPCTPGCRGYRLDIRASDGPVIIGCKDCGVPDRFARVWPEAWRAMANRLSEKKLDAVDP